ncbi:hypothetical protein JTE90_028366 [Oedothorax gibbosus]|uniref:Gag-like protein n=1 Tax=Oedothorax gibbosus TaxID=931172 RepID=A0AAV6TRT3_9ARAC|nr:hypothetical protein JTE90_028366 [Oedothorax gibbosus]
MASQRGKETPKTLLGIKNSSDYKKFNKVDSPKSCDILESWVVTLASEPELASFRENVNALTDWLSEVRDLRLGYGLQNLMAGLFLDPILDGLKNFHRNTIFLNEEIVRLTVENTKLKAENDLNTSHEERQELRLLTSENATLISQSQELLSRVQFLEAKESALMDLKSDLDQKLSDAVAPVVNTINNKIDALNKLTEDTFGKIREQETKVLNQYKTFLDEIKIGRRQEQELVRVIQAREDEVLKAAEKLLTTEVPEPAWLAAFLDKASSLGERVSSPPLGPPAAVPTATSKVDVGASSGGLELVLLQEKGNKGDLMSEFRKDLLVYCNEGNINIKILKIVKLNTGIKLIVNDKTDLVKLEGFIEGTKYSNLSHFCPKKLSPRIIIKFTTITDSNDLIKKLVMNNEIFGDGGVKVLFNIPLRLRFGQRFHWVLEIQPSLFGSIMSLDGVFLDLDLCQIAEFVSVRFCRNCLVYGHTAKFCKSEISLCYKCGKNKHDDECDSINCFTCQNKNENMQIKSCQLHFAGTAKCPFYEREKYKMGERVNRG